MSEHASPSGISRLAAVIKEAGDVMRVEDVVQALSVSRTHGSKLLSRWASKGWLQRVGTGVYCPVPLDLLDAEQVVEDPWTLVPPLFAPAYVGGRTAAEHWDLTEQIFRDVVVFTSRPVRTPVVKTQNLTFTLMHIKPRLIFGTRPVWRGRTKVAVSDVHRTIIDMLNAPATGGGIQHVSDCLDQYLRRPDSDIATLVSYAERLGNGAVFKRLGFLAERHADGTDLAELCKLRLTQGHAKLDPNLECPRLVTRWRLRVPDSWL